MKYNVNKKNCRLLTTKWSVGGYFLFPIVEVEHWSLFKKKKNIGRFYSLQGIS